MSNRDSFASSVRDSVTSNRFSSLLSPSSGSSTPTSFNPSLQQQRSLSSSSSSPYVIPSTSSATATGTSKRTSIIYDRPVTKTKGGEVSLAAWAFLFGEIVHYTQSKVSGIGEFEKRLNIIGYRVGVRLIELLPLRDYVHPSTSSLRSPPPPTRTLRLLPILSYVHSTLYRYLFGRPADSLERSTENLDEYMIGDDDMILTRGVEVPKEMSELSCGALVAGIIEAVMDGAGFPARVTAHSVPTIPHPRRTVILIKLDPEILERESALGTK